MRAGKRELIHCLELAPAKLFGLWKGLGNFSEENLQVDSVAGDRVFQTTKGIEKARGESQAGLGLTFDLDSISVGFYIRKFPEIGIDDIWRALSNQEVALRGDHECDKVTSRAGGS